MRPRWPSIVVLTLGAGCASVRMPPLEFPAERDVERVAVEANRTLGAATPPILIEDRGRVAEIARFLEARNDDWRRARSTFPTPFYSVTLACAGRAERVVWIGRDWIGTKAEGGGQFRTLGPAEGLELRRLLGLPPSP